MNHFSQQTSIDSNCIIFANVFQMLRAVARFPESLLGEQGISLAQVYIKATSLCGFYSRTFRPSSSLPLTPATWGKYPGVHALMLQTDCDDAEETRIVYFRQSFHHALSYKSHQRHSGISVLLTFKPPLATLQLFPLLRLLYTSMLNRWWTLLQQLLLSNPLLHKVASGCPRDEGWAASGAVVGDLEDIQKNLQQLHPMPILASQSISAEDQGLSLTFIMGTISNTMVGYAWCRAKALLHMW